MAKARKISQFGTKYNTSPYTCWPSGLSGELKRKYGFNSSDILILVELTAWTNKTHPTSCWVSQRIIAERTGILQSQVNKSINKMTKTPVLRIAKQAKKGRPNFMEGPEEITTHYDLRGLLTGEVSEALEDPELQNIINKMNNSGLD